MSELEPALETIVHQMAAEGVPALHSLSVAGAREAYDSFTREHGPDVPGSETKEMKIQGPAGPIPLHVFKPDAAETAPVLLWFHGGGWALGSAESYAPFYRYLADQLGCVVVGVGYRRAPEHQFPTGLAECYRAVSWVSSHSRTVFGNGTVLIGGDSAGGNLAAATALLARDRGTPEIDYQVLVYPVTKFTFRERTYDRPPYLLSQDDVDRFWDLYLETELLGKHPYAAPLSARDLAGVPPASVVTCGFDPLREEGEAYADQLATAGVSVQHHHYPQMAHGYLPLLADPAVPTAEETIATLADDIAKFK